MDQKIDDRARAAIARGWPVSALAQPEYARLHGISARTLREWCQRFAPTGPPVRQLRLIIEDAVRRLQDLLAAIDGESSNVIAEPGVPIGEEVIAEPGVPIGEEVIAEPGVPIGEEVIAEPGVPIGEEVIAEPGVPIGEEVIAEPGVPIGEEVAGLPKGTPSGTSGNSLVAVQEREADDHVNGAVRVEEPTIAALKPAQAMPPARHGGFVWNL